LHILGVILKEERPFGFMKKTLQVWKLFFSKRLLNNFILYLIGLDSLLWFYKY